MANIFECIRKDVVERACHVSIKAHKSGKPFVVEKKSSEILIAFAGSWSLNDWYVENRPFGETKVDLQLFPSLRSIGNDEVALVNDAFLRRFLKIKDNTSLSTEVEKAVIDKKQIIFAGHSSGGPIAIFAAIWFFEEYVRSKGVNAPPFCLTFGSPLTANFIFSHAVRRENWSDYFINFVSRFDIVPRILLAPQSSINDELRVVLSYFDPNSPSYNHDLIEKGDAARDFFMKVIRNASCAASYAACVLMGSTNMLLSTLSNFVDLSPYRPFGTYVFCAGNGKSLVVKNPNVVLQMLFYSSQLSSEAECPAIASASLKCHLLYETEVRQSFGMQNVEDFDRFQEIPLNPDGRASNETNAFNMILNDLGLGARAKLCLRAAKESEKQKWDNKNQIEGKRDNIEKFMKILESYRTSCESRGVGYYDSFKKQMLDEDFKANVKRLELAGIWDEIIEMLKRYELPDTFEAERSWVDLGTQFRRLVEPLDIANYYRHSKNEDTGSYMTRGRPRRYKYTQRWLEHDKKKPEGFFGESCFWGELEEDLNEAAKNGTDCIDATNRVKEIERKLKVWYDEGLVKKDVFLKDTTLVKWWNRLPESHRAVSCIKDLINN